MRCFSATFGAIDRNMSCPHKCAGEATLWARLCWLVWAITIGQKPTAMSRTSQYVTSLFSMQKHFPVAAELILYSSLNVWDSSNSQCLLIGHAETFLPMVSPCSTNRVSFLHPRRGRTQTAALGNLLSLADLQTS